MHEKQLFSLTLFPVQVLLKTQVSQGLLVLSRLLLSG